MKSTTGAFVVTNSCIASGDMLGGCERGSGNDSAQAGVGFGCLSIQFEGKGKADPHHVNPSHPVGLYCQIHQIRGITLLDR
jgi:hypothetical protein